MVAKSHRAWLMAFAAVLISLAVAGLALPAGDEEGDDVVAAYCATRAAAVVAALRALDENERPLNDAELARLARLVETANFSAKDEHAARPVLLVAAETGDGRELQFSRRRAVDLLLVHPAAFDRLLLHDLLGLLEIDDRDGRLSSRWTSEPSTDAPALQTALKEALESWPTHGLFGEEYRDAWTSPDFEVGPITVLQRTARGSEADARILSFRSRLLRHLPTGRVFCQFYTWRDEDDGGNTCGWFEDPETLAVVAEIHDSGIEHCSIRSFFPLTPAAP